MRLASTFVLSSLAGATFPFVSAGHVGTSLTSRRLAGLQHREPRDLIDICVVIPNLVVDVLNLLGLGADVCLCLKDLDLYLRANVTASLQQQTIANVKAAIGKAPNSGQCNSLPAHAQRQCSVVNPCAFICVDGYTLDSESQMCVCSAPNTECNGKCGPPVAGCGASAVSRSLKSRSTPITTLRDAQKTCGSRTVCGVAQPKGDYDFDCVDTVTDFDSCGGCVTPHPFSGSQSTVGLDCGRISNAQQVSCQKSKCVVQKCRKDFTISTTKDACTQEGRSASRRGSILDLPGLLTATTSGPITIGPDPGDSPNVAAAAPAVVAPSVITAMAPVIAGASALASCPACGSADKSGLLGDLHLLIGVSALPSLVVKINVTISAAQALEDAVKKITALLS
ncbi:hypothetical protein C8F04DRAFT_225444 [Mycena alexandri]|uniref:Protein CPL1-like domain-containing protein n=1 Tax=Mycena alexandri TaxID=1745969 RepID=A0AAD6T7X4_9AGAR|nr:hypothetical protein C8F04DRAFT_225444 [Mycena alexandri]